MAYCMLVGTKILYKIDIQTLMQLLKHLIFLHKIMLAFSTIGAILVIQLFIKYMIAMTLQIQEKYSEKWEMLIQK